MTEEVSNADVIAATEELVTTSADIVTDLKTRLSKSGRHRVRFCVHCSLDDLIHEMLIAMDPHSYVRPHSHPGKSESFHVIEGTADVVVFDAEGNIVRVIRMEAYPSKKTFYYRLSNSAFHTVLVRSDVFVVHETTNGPFRRDDTVFAPWAPKETDSPRVKTFLKDLDSQISLFARQPSVDEEDRGRTRKPAKG